MDSRSFRAETVSPATAPAPKVENEEELAEDEDEAAELNAFGFATEFFVTTVPAIPFVLLFTPDLA